MFIVLVSPLCFGPAAMAWLSSYKHSIEAVFRFLRSGIPLSQKRYSTFSEAVFRFSDDSAVLPERIRRGTILAARFSGTLAYRNECLSRPRAMRPFRP
ncbi:hypothetical protein [Mesorhizobium sp.]|uniref:hypothetical protein n=1 Tax=Mesorhizobium sp. TaxID=1871066 RepID=UPI0011F4A756|nr:hypothetical protein [Mesorhizobium sp.]TIN80071.1 MAG: hypothetical protein E5Y09_06720 [Mesorhizobium sp.]